MKVYILSIALSFCLASISAFAASSRSFYCHEVSTGSLRDYFDVSTSVESTITQTSEGASLDYYNFDYLIMDGDYVWSQASVKEINPLHNNTRYNPRVYKEHFQFNFSKGIFGSVYFIVPKKVLTSTEKKFTAYLIMTHIEDHAGGTVRVECSFFN
jgi:hypothetical protein